MKTNQRLGAILFAALLATPAALSQTTSELIAQEEAAKLETCLTLADEDAEAAYELGLAWLGQGSRPAARYCTARALIAKGQIMEGAYRLETLASAPDVWEDERRVSFLVQAGNAYLLAEEPGAAVIAFDNALLLSPKEPSVLRDRAGALILLERYNDAVGDLNQVIEKAPDDGAALFLRAKAFLMTERLDLAFADIERARETDPQNVDMLVLRGDIREAIRLAKGE